MAAKCGACHQVIDYVITMKIIFLANLGPSPHICNQNEAVLKIYNFQNERHFEVVINILPEVIPEFEYASKFAMCISNILSFWSTL